MWGFPGQGAAVRDPGLRRPTSTPWALMVGGSRRAPWTQPWLWSAPAHVALGDGSPPEASRVWVLLFLLCFYFLSLSLSVSISVVVSL